MSQANTTPGYLQPTEASRGQGTSTGGGNGGTDNKRPSGKKPNRNKAGKQQSSSKKTTPRNSSPSGGGTSFTNVSIASRNPSPSGNVTTPTNVTNAPTNITSILTPPSNAGTTSPTGSTQSDVTPVAGTRGETRTVTMRDGTVRQVPSPVAQNTNASTTRPSPIDTTGLGTMPRASTNDQPGNRQGIYAPVAINPAANTPADWTEDVTETPVAHAGNESAFMPNATFQNDLTSTRSTMTRSFDFGGRIGESVAIDGGPTSTRSTSAPSFSFGERIGVTRDNDAGTPGKFFAGLAGIGGGTPVGTDSTFHSLSSDAQEHAHTETHEEFMARLQSEATSNDPSGNSDSGNGPHDESDSNNDPNDGTGSDGTAGQFGGNPDEGDIDPFNLIRFVYRVHGGDMSAWTINGMLPAQELFRVRGSLRSSVPYQVELIHGHGNFVTSALMATVRAVQHSHAPGIGEQQLLALLTQGMQGLYMNRCPLGFEHGEWEQLFANDMTDAAAVRIIRDHLEYALSRGPDELPVEIHIWFDSEGIEVRRDALPGQFNHVRRPTNGLQYGAE